ncbi:glycoside hydrolase family 3 C-terminal domain-containing protein [Erythrobacteraceae bacterium E2-1 Yellow Sea]|nr:glycoside hydrolase family 3 C-terminal domain-containing protein [Erythrobacteraceae bacterium E2-1 Yellow Sea]
MFVTLGGCAAAQAEAPRATPASEVQSPAQNDDIAELIARMSLEHKVAQLIQPQINSFTAEDMKRYRFGSYLNGGNGGPYGDEIAPASEWLRLADEMWDASTAPLPDGEPIIPTIWGTDAVHGHTNVYGATIFPHNIALGAAGDADLVRRIGAATAAEIEATGIDWNFSPTVAVAQDDRWGRTYESYSEDPQLVSRLGAALVEGLQGKKGDPNHLGKGHVIATAKHFFGDGGTEQGVDQGEVNGDIEALKALHAMPYPVAIEAGVEAIMASFNSINGKKMHGNRELLTGVLRCEFGFDGVVVGDWNGHGQIKGCTVTDCPQALLAGLDIYMVPDDWKALHANLVRQVRNGTIPMERLDEAVGRVLRMKQRAGLLAPDARKPSQRGVGGKPEYFGSRAHRDIAREAVAKSQVILKNNGVLPLKPGASVLVAGSAADNIGQASGGWTLTWQGGRDLDRRLFPGATSIWEGIDHAVNANGGKASLSPDGSYDEKPDVAIVVFGEKPYAEFAGDKKDLVLRDEEGLELLRGFKAQGIPTVAVFLSGRPMWMNRELNAADAFVASWLPGSEGAGVADVLTGASPATGRLSFSWPIHCDGQPVNGPQGALFPFGYGRSLNDVTALGMLNEACGVLGDVVGSEFFVSGRLAAGVNAIAYLPSEEDTNNAVVLEQFRGAAADLGIAVRGIDRNAQEDAREIEMQPGSAFAIVSPLDQASAFRITYAVEQRPTGSVWITVGTKDEVRAKIDVTRALETAAGKGWREMLVTSMCAPGMGSGVGFESEQGFVLRIAAVKREELPENTPCSF